MTAPDPGPAAAYDSWRAILRQRSLKRSASRSIHSNVWSKP